MTKNFTNIKPLNPHRTVIEQISKCFLICIAKRFSMFADYTPEEVTFPQHPLFKIFFFDVGHFLKFLLNLLQYCFCFMFCFVLFLATRQMGSQLPSQGSNPRPRHWKVKSQPLDHQGSPSGILLGQRTVIHGQPPAGGLHSVSSCPPPHRTAPSVPDHSPHSLKHALLLPIIIVFFSGGGDAVWEI